MTQLFLSTAGTGRPFADFEVSDLADRIQRVLVEMAADPERPLSSLDLLGGHERAELAEIGNQAVLTWPKAAPVSIPDLFAEQVAAAPDAAALTFEGRTLTYRELDEAANRLAHLLAAQGVRPGERVALYSNRSARAVVGMLAILKTGAAYVPIDPAVPASRMEFILADAAPIAAVTTAKLRSRLDGYRGIVIDIDDPAIEAQPGTPVQAPAPADIAYVIYTSGTTGTPKGVAVTHHNLTQLMISLDASLPRRAVWPLCHSLGFDASVWEIGHALLRGGRLVVVPESVAGSPEDFHRLLVAEGVSVFTQTPSAVAMPSPQGLESAVLVVAGEACPTELVDRWAAAGRVMFDAYGPTEDHDLCGDEAHRCRPERPNPSFYRLTRAQRRTVRTGHLDAAGADRRGG